MDFDPDTGYQQYVDINSFVDEILIQEFSNDVDSHHASMFLHKDKDSKLKMGPIWDFNISLGNANYDNGEYPEFARLFGDDSEWSKHFISDSNFIQIMNFRWVELRSKVLSKDNIFSIIDSASNLLMEAQERNFEKWDIMGRAIWPNPKPVPVNYQGEIERLKTFISKRLDWMDRKIPELNETTKTPLLN